MMRRLDGSAAPRFGSKKMGARCLVALLLQLGPDSEQRRLLERVRLSKLARRRQGRRRAREVVRVFHELGKELRPRPCPQSLRGSGGGGTAALDVAGRMRHRP